MELVRLLGKIAWEVFNLVEHLSTIGRLILFLTGISLPGIVMFWANIGWGYVFAMSMAGFLVVLGLIVAAPTVLPWLTPFRTATAAQLRLRFVEHTRPYYQTFENHQVHLSVGRLTYCRVGVANEGDSTVDDVSVVLHALSPDTVGRHNLPLQFMHDTVLPYRRSISLAPKTEVFVDVVAYFDAFLSDDRLRLTHTIENATPEIGSLPVQEYVIDILASGRHVLPDLKRFRIGVQGGVLYMEEEQP